MNIDDLEFRLHKFYEEVSAWSHQKEDAALIKEALDTIIKLRAWNEALESQLKEAAELLNEYQSRIP